MDLSLKYYAQSIARSFKRPIDEVRVEAKGQVERILKDGLSTKGHFFFNVVENETAVRIGLIWFNVEEEKNRAFLYDIFIYEPYRGKGYGKKTLELLETKLREMNVSELGLHVFADNQVAINLYKAQGYQTASFNMRKEL